MTSRDFGQYFLPPSPIVTFLITHYSCHRILDPLGPWRHLRTTPTHFGQSKELDRFEVFFLNGLAFGVVAKYSGW